MWIAGRLLVTFQQRVFPHPSGTLQTIDSAVFFIVKINKSKVVSSTARLIVKEANELDLKVFLYKNKKKKKRKVFLFG